MITLASHKGTYNGPFPSFPVPLLQNEPPCKTLLMKMSLNEREPVGGTLFNMNDFGRRLVLTERQKASLEMAYSGDQSKPEV